MNKFLKKLIYSDLYRYTGKIDRKTYWIQYVINCSFRYTAIYRKAKYYHSKNKILYMVYRYKLLKLSKRYGYQIQYNTNIGKGLYLGHRGTIIINGKAKLGNNINIATGVTIGQENRGKRTGVPNIGDCVWIGTNSVIVGNIKIGNNVLIAPNTFINFEVPDNSIVIGNPGKIVPNKADATDYYVHNVYELRE